MRLSNWEYTNENKPKFKFVDKDKFYLFKFLLQIKYLLKNNIGTSDLYDMIGPEGVALSKGKPIDKDIQRWIGMPPSDELRNFLKLYEHFLGGKFIDKKWKFDEGHIEQYPVAKYIEKRIARLTWNTNLWIRPSGYDGKSKNSQLFEATYGYGNEEWLFDKGKIIDGFHYSFLEPLRINQNTFAGKTYDIWLYAINGETKQRFYVGTLQNVSVLTLSEAKKIKQIYNENDWLEEMEEQIISAGGKPEYYDIDKNNKWNNIAIFNIKFQFRDALIEDTPLLIPPQDPIYKLHRYNFNHFSENNRLSIAALSKEKEFIFSHQNSRPSGSSKRSYVIEKKIIEKENIHNEIAEGMYHYLCDVYGEDNVEPEHPSGVGATEIDIVVKDKEKFIFYEIKTIQPLRLSIREALGQLFEYSYYPIHNRAGELIIVTPYPADEDTKRYMEHIRNKFDVPVYYQSFDRYIKKLSEKC